MLRVYWKRSGYSTTRSGDLPWHNPAHRQSALASDNGSANNGPEQASSGDREIVGGSRFVIEKKPERLGALGQVNEIAEGALGGLSGFMAEAATSPGIRILVTGILPDVHHASLQVWNRA